MARGRSAPALGLVAGAAAAAAGVVTASNFIAPGGGHYQSTLRHGPQSNSMKTRMGAEGDHMTWSQRIEDAQGTSGGHWFVPMLRWVGAGVAAGLLAASFSTPAQAFGEWDTPEEVNGKRWRYLFFSGDWLNKDGGKYFDPKTNPDLSLCRDNKAFKKIMKDELFQWGNRQKKFPKNSVPWKRWETKIANTKRRQEAFGERYCDKAGHPNVILNPTAKRGGIILPSLMFLYIAGWIGWAGREYLSRAGGDTDYEINIRVPLALSCMASGFAWPVNSWKSITEGTFVAKDEDIYQSGIKY